MRLLSLSRSIGWSINNQRKLKFYFKQKNSDEMTRTVITATALRYAGDQGTTCWVFFSLFFLVSTVQTPTNCWCLTLCSCLNPLTALLFFSSSCCCCCCSIAVLQCESRWVAAAGLYSSWAELSYTSRIGLPLHATADALLFLLNLRL